MRKIISFMHTSLDDFAAGPNREMDWIHVDQEIFDYAGNQTDNADTALYGRITFEMMDNYWPTAGTQPGASKHDIQHSKWYNAVEKVVLSRTLKSAPSNRVHVIGDNLASEILKLKQQAGTNIVIFGSPGAVHSLLKEDLIDEFWIFVNPVILGNGIPYLHGGRRKLRLKLSLSRAFSSGVVCLQYVKEQKN
jgi:dihydrofolate reductase